MRSWFLAGLPLPVRMFRFRHWGSHSVNKLIRWVLSAWISSRPLGWERRSSSMAVSSMRLCVVFGSLPQSQRPASVTHPHPPAPGLPRDEPSVAAVILLGSGCSVTAIDRPVKSSAGSLGRGPGGVSLFYSYLPWVRNLSAPSPDIPVFAGAVRLLTGFL